MGMFEKIKNLFYDEEVIEVPKETLKEEVKVSTSVSVKEEIKDEMDTIISERDLVKKETNFKFPVIFEDEDFEERPKRVEPKPIERNNYSRVEEQRSNYKKPTLDREVIKEVIEKPKKFKPSPVISPVYGVLDKNYKKDEELSGKHGLEQTKELVINFDTIRQKAYGTLSDDIEMELTSSPKENRIDEIEKEIDNILVENNILSDLEEDDTTISTVIDDSDEYNYSDFGVEYKISEDNTLSNEIEEEPDEEIEVTKESKKEKIKEKKVKEENVELTEDLFNLIDSMYDR